MLIHGHDLHRRLADSSAIFVWVSHERTITHTAHTKLPTVFPFCLDRFSPLLSLPLHAIPSSLPVLFTFLFNLHLVLKHSSIHPPLGWLCTWKSIISLL